MCILQLKPFRKFVVTLNLHLQFFSFCQRLYQQLRMLNWIKSHVETNSFYGKSLKYHIYLHSILGIQHFNFATSEIISELAFIICLNKIKNKILFQVIFDQWSCIWVKGY